MFVFFVGYIFFINLFFLCVTKYNELNLFKVIFEQKKMASISRSHFNLFKKTIAYPSVFSGFGKRTFLVIAIR